MFKGPNFKQNMMHK